jgi:hypothetical protein
MIQKIIEANTLRHALFLSAKNTLVSENGSSKAKNTPTKHPANEEATAVTRTIEDRASSFGMLPILSVKVRLALVL